MHDSPIVQVFLVLLQPHGDLDVGIELGIYGSLEALLDEVLEVLLPHVSLEVVACCEDFVAEATRVVIFHVLGVDMTDEVFPGPASGSRAMMTTYFA